MAYTFEELKHKTVADLREIAKGLEGEPVKGYTQMNKEHLLTALAEALNLPKHEHHEAVGLDKAAVKAQIKELKKRRDGAAEAHDHALLKTVRREIHSLKVKLHRAER